MIVLTIPLTPEQKEIIKKFAKRKGFGNCSSFARSLIIDFIDKNSYNIELTEKDFLNKEVEN